MTKKPPFFGVTTKDQLYKRPTPTKDQQGVPTKDKHLEFIENCPICRVFFRDFLRLGTRYFVPEICC